MSNTNDVSLETAIAETRKLLPDDTDFSYITEEFLSADATEVEREEKTPRFVMYGHNMSYGSRNGLPTYEFYGGAPTMNNVCSDRRRHFAYHHDTRHSSTGRRCSQHNNSTIIKFEVY